MSGSDTGGRTSALGGTLGGGGLSTVALTVRPLGPGCRLVRLDGDRDLDGEVVADRFQFPVCTPGSLTGGVSVTLLLGVLLLLCHGASLKVIGVGLGDDPVRRLFVCPIGAFVDIPRLISNYFASRDLRAALHMRL